MPWEVRLTVCGLTFLYAPGLEKNVAQVRTRRALDRMVHRGPDEQGLVSGEGWVMGHRRLSIIDVSTSHQPMVCPENRYHLAYNGEVYNFRELRNRLSGKWLFRTEGDTEVVLAGLIVFGHQFLDLMEGMWALALWDSEKESLFLSRDRMGKKPLYYRIRSGRFTCASELPILAQLENSEWSEDLDSTADYLRYGYYLPGTTAYTGVKEVLPSHWLTWKPGSDPLTQSYWSLQIGQFEADRQFAAAKLREAMDRSIDRRLVADVEVGAFLSGGIDSSVIVALQTLRSGVPPKTFTIGFGESSFDERGYARLVSNYYHTEHHEGLLDRWNSEDLKRLILDHIGQPFLDPSILPTAMVSKLAASSVKVALSGDGSDELFSGYQRYQARALLRWYTRIPELARRPLERVIRKLPEPLFHHSRSLLKKVHLFLDTSQRIGSETPYVAPMYYTDDQYSALAPELVNKGHIAPALPESCTPDDVHRMMTSDALIYLPQDILAKVDRASMAHSIETRAPFLDRQVVELAFSLPRKWHRRGFEGKRILRESFGDLLPTDIWKRRKQGFGVPVGQWFHEGLASELGNLVESQHAPLERSEIARMLNEHLKGQRDHGLRLWQLYIYLMWQAQLKDMVLSCNV